jgi:cytochrome c-type biogenesis protein CcmH
MLRLASLACFVAIAGAAVPFDQQQQQQQQQAQADSLLEARTSEVASQLRCPVCQGLSIQESPSDLSQQMRAIVRDQLKAGRTPEEVKAYFVSKYGEWILLEPKPRGFNLLVYALPALLVLGGLGVIAVAVRKWTRLPDAARDRIPH